MTDVKAQWPSECRGADVLANCFRVFQKRKSHEPKRHPRCFFCRIATGASGNATRHAEIYRDLQQIREALVQSGYTKLDQQAKALGVHRSTAWTIIKTRHKLGRLSAKTTQRILANPDTPPSVRSVIQKYLAERSLG